MFIFLQLGSHVNVLSVQLWLFLKSEMVRQRVTGTEWCIQMPLMICFELPVPENCELCCWCCCCYTSLCMVSSQASLGIVYTMSTDIWATLFAESARAVCSVSMPCECGYTPAGQHQIWAVCSCLRVPEPPSCTGSHGEVWSQPTCSMSRTSTSLFNLAEPTLTLAQPLGCSPSLQQEKDYL